MSCNPYAIFGFGDFSLPSCDDLSQPLVVGDPVGRKPLDPLTFDPVDAPCSGSRASYESALAGLGNYLSLVGATDPRIPKSAGVAEYQSFLFQRQAAFLRCRDIAGAREMNGVNPLTGMPFTAMELDFVAKCSADPVACRNLIAAQQQMLPLRVAVGPDVTFGGPMSSPFMLGVGIGAPGGAMPLSFLPQPFIGSGGGQDLLGGLLQGGIQLGTTFLQQQLLAKQQEDAFKRQRELLLLQAQIGSQPLGFGQQGQVQVGPDGTLTMGGNGMPLQGPSWSGFEGGACCPKGPVTLSPMDAPSLYRQGCGPCATVTPRSRFFALRANGTRDLFVRVGTVNSVSPRTLTKFARRWAKQAKLTVGARGARRGRRRPR